MTEAPNNIEEFVSQTVAGSMIAQIARHRDLDLENVLNLRRPEDVMGIAYELEQLGLDPSLTAKHLMLALAAMFIERENATTIIDAFADILWKILGAPDTGGKEPPALYRKAAFVMHLTLTGFFDPSIPEKVIGQ